MTFGERRWPVYAAATGIALGGLGLRFAVEPALKGGYPFITFFPAVALAAYLLGPRPAFLTLALGAVTAWYFFITPQSTYVFDLQVLVALLLFVVFSLIVIRITDALQTANRDLAVEREANRVLALNRETLFLELQHRVGNNLQVVSSMLALQRRGLADPQARAAIDDASRRVGLIGRVQRHLYDPDGAALGLQGFLDRLAADVLATSGRDDVRVTVALDRPLELKPVLSISVALIVAELVYNAIEHGLGSRAGEIRLTVAQGDDIVIAVADDGDALPPCFKLADGNNLGLRLAGALAQSHGGALRIAGADGWTTARLVLPLAVAAG
ncbi:MAG: sensor histidine kinase [Novosphingobium sp.]